MTFAQDIERCMKLACLCCLGGGGKKMQRSMFFHWILMGGFLYFWIHFNGGIWPAFLKNSSILEPGGRSDMLHHFSSHVQGDGLMVTWAHATNSIRKTKAAVASDVMMVEGDILLKGQSTADQQLIPIMAHPPGTDSDITLDHWLDLVLQAGKGVKLDFKSIEAVDLALQILAGKNEKIRAPVHLSAEVADGPNNFMAPNKLLDPVRFIRQCRDKFPAVTLALGWTNGWSEEGQQLYTWSMVKTMYDIVEAQKLQQPITYNVRARLAKNSVTELKWLIEMTGGTLTLFSPPDDNLKANDILTIRHRIPKEKVFYDIDQSLKQDLEKVPQDGGIDERQKFRVSQWKAVRSKGGEKIFLGSEALIFQNGLLVSKNQHKPEEGGSVTVKGKVEFINIPTVSDKGDSATTPVGLGIFLRVSQGSQATIISGIRCFIGFDGKLEISTQSVPGVDRKAVGEVTGTSTCFAFTITDSPIHSTITLSATRLKNCADAFPQPDDENVANLEFSMKDIEIDSYYMGLRAPSDQAFVVVDQFLIEGSTAP